MTYAEKLKDSRWQKKRLEVLQRENFTCEGCGASADSGKRVELHVHHCYYERGLNPWEYPDIALKCLCSECHETRQWIELEIQKYLATFSFYDLDAFRSMVFYSIAFHGFGKFMDVLEAMDKPLKIHRKKK